MTKKSKGLLAKNRRVSISALTAVVVAAAGFGVYFKFFSEAAPSYPYFEAEEMSVPPTISPTYFWNQTVSDSTASKGKAKKIYGNYFAIKYIYYTKIGTFAVHAKGERLSLCSNGAPNMKIYVDGVLQRTVSAVSSTWADYHVTVNGGTQIKIGMTNDTPYCDRNLLLDYVNLNL